MITFDIPGFKKIEAEHLVLDFNGTLAIDGKMIDGVEQQLKQLSEKLKIHVLTADTFGTSANELKCSSCELVILKTEMQDHEKGHFVSALGGHNVIAIGNGQNDANMLWQAELSIMVIQQEGAFAKLINVSDLVCFSVTDALNLLLNPMRIVATLRK